MLSYTKALNCSKSSLKFFPAIRMPEHSMLVVNKAATLIALRARPTKPSAAPDMIKVFVQSNGLISFFYAVNHSEWERLLLKKLNISSNNIRDCWTGRFPQSSLMFTVLIIHNHFLVHHVINEGQSHQTSLCCNNHQFTVYCRCQLDINFVSRLMFYLKSLRALISEYF